MKKSEKRIRTWKERPFIVELWRHSKAEPLQATLLRTRFLYNQVNHLYTQSTGLFYSFLLRDKTNGSDLALIHFSQVNQTLVSLPKAPFGGIESFQNDSDAGIPFLLRCIDDYASNAKLSSVSIKTPVSCYHPSFATDYHNLYKSNVFEVQQSLLNHVIPVSNVSFESLLHNSERRRLRKCKTYNFRTQLIEQPDSIYRFILQARKSKGYPVSISRETFNRLLAEFPENVLPFAVFDASTLIAVALTIKVTDDVLYNFLPVSSSNYGNFSPMVFLSEFIYNFCQNNGISFLDLGTSCDHHCRSKPGLVKFKENLGGLAYPKLTFTKSY